MFFSSTVFVIKFSMNKNLFFFNFVFFFSATMNFVNDLLKPTGERGDGEGDVPLSVQRAWCAFLQICEPLCRKKSSTEFLS